MISTHMISSTTDNIIVIITISGARCDFTYSHSCILSKPFVFIVLRFKKPHGNK